MPIQYTVGTADVTSETPEIPALLLCRNRGVGVSTLVNSLTILTLTARDRSPDFFPNNSTTNLAAIPRRRRRVLAESHALTDGNLEFTVTLPSLGTPIGKLFLDSQDLKNVGTLTKNKSCHIGFFVEGKRLTYPSGDQRLPLLRARFSLYLLNGTRKVYKTSEQNGIIFDEDVQIMADGRQVMTGFIILKPSDLNFREKQIELRYQFCLGNDGARKHEIEEGYLIFN